MLFLRTYVLYERSIRVLVLMVGVAVGTVVVGLVRRPQPIIYNTTDEKHYSGQSSWTHPMIPA
jgi:multisubunit Na+/H+ antiporter MnhE subunit